MKVLDIINILDNDEEIVNSEFDGLKIWPVLRYVVLQHLIDKINKLSNPKGISSSLGFFTKLSGLLNALLFSCPFLGPQKTTLIFNTATSNVKDEKGIYFNRIVDYFFDVNSTETWAIEDPIGFCHVTPRNHKVYSRLIFNVLSEVFARLTLHFNKRKSAEAHDIITHIINRISMLMSTSGLQIDTEIKLNLVKGLLKMQPNYFLYKQLFRSRKVKTILIEDGYYGLEKASLIKAAKDLNIKVIEPQHGFINENHPSYNYGMGVLNNEAYKMYVPDTLLCYGEFWANSIQIPGEKYILGNPHLEKSLKNLEHVIVLKKILVLGSGVTINETNELLTKLLRIKPSQYEVVYRPHPQERSDVSLRYGIPIANGIRIDEKELFYSMAESEIIIGELTTAIFEAAALQKKVFLYNSSYTKTYFTENIKHFKLFSLTDIAIIFEDYIPDISSSEYYWAKDWETKYRQFMQAN